MLSNKNENNVAKVLDCQVSSSDSSSSIGGCGGKIGLRDIHSLDGSGMTIYSKCLLTSIMLHNVFLRVTATMNL